MAVLLVGLLLYLRRNQQRSIGYLLCFSLFYVYLLYVVKYTIFPLRLFDAQYTEYMRSAGVIWSTGINLIPFRDVSIPYVLSVQGMGNLLLAVPFGLGLPFIVTTDLRSIIRRGLLFTVSIELMQLLINVAYGYRVRTVDVNDLLFNFPGVMVGYGLFSLLARLYRTAVVMPKEPKPGAWSHIHSVLTR